MKEMLFAYPRGRQGNLIVHQVVDKESKRPTNRYHFWFYCPGCEEHHMFEIPRWTFDGNFQKPTFTPSLQVQGRCHLVLSEGQLRFMDDSKHALAGRRVELPPPPKWME